MSILDQRSLVVHVVHDGKTPLQHAQRGRIVRIFQSVRNCKWVNLFVSLHTCSVTTSHFVGATSLGRVRPVFVLVHAKQDERLAALAWFKSKQALAVSRTSVCAVARCEDVCSARYYVSSEELQRLRLLA